MRNLTMNKQKYKEIKKVFKNNKGYARTKNIIDAGIRNSHFIFISTDR